MFPASSETLLHPLPTVLLVLIAVHLEAQERTEVEAPVPGNFRAAGKQQAGVQLGKCRDCSRGGNPP